MNRDLSPFKYLIDNKKQKTLNYQSRQLILNIYANLRLANPTKLVNDVILTVSSLCGVSKSTVYNIKKQFNENGKLKTPNKMGPKCQLKNKRSDIYDDFTKTALRKIVHDFYRQGTPPTVRRTAAVFSEDPNLPKLKKSAIHGLMQEIGFKYEKVKRRSVLIEDERIAQWRKEFLLDMQRYRKEGRAIYYLDETWVNQGHFVNKAFHDTTIRSKRDAMKRGLTTGLRLPRSKGKRLIILHIGSKEGFVPGASLVFTSKTNSADYHDEMNGEHFQEWMKETLPKLKPGMYLPIRYHTFHLF